MSNTITVPFCFLPNSKKQVFDMDTCKRSEFQIHYLYNVSRQSDFAYFVIMHDVGRELIIAPEHKNSVNVMWYTKDGHCYSVLLGRKVVLQSFDKKLDDGDTPVPLDDIVYTSRCQ